MDYIQELQGVVVTYSEGNMFLFKCDPSSNQKVIDSEDAVQDVGEMEDGFLTGCWAPNQEYLALATKTGKLIVLTPEFDVLYEAPIDDGDLTFHDVQAG